jgi:hypothetical protein
MKRLALAAALAGCVASGRVSTTTTPIVYEEPPQDKMESAEARPGAFWEKGRWDWQNGQWAWIGGHYEPQRANQQWEAGRWERRGSAWHWIDGRWIGTQAVVETPPTATVIVPAPEARPMYPTAAPPQPRAENSGTARPGELWIAGHWDWQGGAWAWLAGHWEPVHPNEAWVAGRWELQGSYYVWVEGRWDRRR